ncbi:MAG: PhoU domain-containing protein [Nanoarchaeota archaeon]
MEFRKVQKTGDMNYVYLPTNWCKKFSINSDSKLILEENSNGSLLLLPYEINKKPIHLEIHTNEDNIDIINMLIMGCYINPLSSFNINLKKSLDSTKLLNQKNIISLESVEIEKNVISSNSMIISPDPDLLLKTMIKKIKNLIYIMVNSYNLELIEKYEEEIDRIKTLIEKSVISYMTSAAAPKLKMIDLYYISLISRDLERIVDHIIRLEKTDIVFLKKIEEVIVFLKNNIEKQDLIKNKFRIDYEIAIQFTKKVKSIGKISKQDKHLYDKRRIIGLLNKVSEITIDWSITNNI